jgi:hypothetical protein
MSSLCTKLHMSCSTIYHIKRLPQKSNRFFRTVVKLHMLLSATQNVLWSSCKVPNTKHIVILPADLNTSWYMLTMDRDVTKQIAAFHYYVKVPRALHFFTVSVPNALECTAYVWTALVPNLTKKHVVNSHKPTFLLLEKESRLKMSLHSCL